MDCKDSPLAMYCRTSCPQHHRVGLYSGAKKNPEDHLRECTCDRWRSDGSQGDSVDHTIPSWIRPHAFRYNSRHLAQEDNDNGTNYTWLLAYGRLADKTCPLQCGSGIHVSEILHIHTSTGPHQEPRGTGSEMGTHDTRPERDREPRGYNGSAVRWADIHHQGFTTPKRQATKTYDRFEGH